MAVIAYCHMNMISVFFYPIVEMMKLTKLGGNEKLQYSSVLDLVFTKY